jgi:hypothetical protein
LGGASLRQESSEKDMDDERAGLVWLLPYYFAQIITPILLSLILWRVW